MSSSTTKRAARKAAPIAFAQLRGKPAKRRAICADAIAQLRRGSLKAETGVFVRLPDTAFWTGAALEEAVSADENLTVKTLLAEHKVEQCDVCALGALMMGQFRINGDCKVAHLERSKRFHTDAKLYPFVDGEEDAQGNSVFSPFVLRYFSVPQLQLIEVAFEGGRGAFTCRTAVQDWRDYGDTDSFNVDAQDDSWRFTVQQASAAIAFGERFSSNKGRLTAILQSVINHPRALFAP